MEQPSDIHGLIYIPFRDDVAEVGQMLVKELAEAGIPVDPTRL